MREIAAREAKNRFDQVIEASQRAPVTITRHGRAVSVLLSLEDYKRIRGNNWKRLRESMDALAQEAAAAGMTKADLDELLAGES